MVVNRTFQIDEKKYESFRDLCQSQRLQIGQKLNYMIDVELSKDSKEGGVMPFLDEDISKWVEFFFTMPDIDFESLKNKIDQLSIYMAAYTRKPELRAKKVWMNALTAREIALQ